jgi:hypothetical protein
LLLGRSKRRKVCMGALWLSVLMSILSVINSPKELTNLQYCDTSPYYGLFELQQVQRFWQIRHQLYRDSQTAAMDSGIAFDTVQLIPEFHQYYIPERIIDSLQAPEKYQYNVTKVELGDQIVVQRHWRLAKQTCTSLDLQERSLKNALHVHICMEFATASQYAYEVHHSIYRPPDAHQFQTPCLSRYFVITERKNGQLTHGGSSLRIEITSHDDTSTRIAVCTVQDLFTGVYIGHCPNLGRCLHVKVLLRHPNFLAYSHPSGSYPVKPINRVVHEETYCATSHSGAFLYNGWTWFRDSNHWTWLHKNKPLHYSTSATRKCLLSKTGNVLAIGDSHLRYALDNIFVTHPEFDPWLPRDHKDFTMAGFKYIWTTFAENTASILKGMLRSNSRPPDTLIILAGTWDLMGDRYYENFLNSTGRILVQRLWKLTREKRWRGVRKLWVNVPAFPAQLPSKNNDFVRAAANAWLRKQLRGSGFEEVDTFGISVARSEQFVCLSHFSCRLHNTTYMYGEVGTVITHAILNKIC